MEFPVLKAADFRPNRAASGSGAFPRAARYRLERFQRETRMLRWAFLFLIIGLIAGALGFGGVAGASIGIAKMLFFVFLIVFLVLLVAGLTVARKVSGG
jgi:uncharacterized membrane protein YtjA (UPF0391 family)